MLITWVRAASLAIIKRAADEFLKLATDEFTAASDSAIVDAIVGIVCRTVEALTQSLSGAALIWRGIFTNRTTGNTLDFILNRLPVLLSFLYDLGRPGTVLSESAPESAVDSVVESKGGEFPGQDNPYDELDLRQAVNQHAVVYQVQRIALTLVAVLKLGRQYVQPSGLGDLQMNVSLRSDFDKDGNPPEPTYTSKLGKAQAPPRLSEKWLFINGIANEQVWFRQSCDKIRDKFQREIRGIYNRSDGILWDLIECAGEHSMAELKDVVQRTQSSQAAQEVLERELRDALWPSSGSPPEKVVMIAHSQGCLLLRLVLQALVEDDPNGSQRRKDMKERLRVFTFGNPSIDWQVIDGTEQALSEYAKVTEHFAHKVDFVALLGVVSYRDTGYGSESVFYSKGGRGHLFGAHYPLEAKAYEEGGRSELLKAVNGREIA